MRTPGDKGSYDPDELEVLSFLILTVIYYHL